MLNRRQSVLCFAGTGLSVLGGIQLCRADALPPRRGVKLDSSTAPLVKLLEDTPREHLQAMLVRQMKKGVPYRKLLEAAFLYPVLWQGHHSVYLVHAAHQLSLDVPSRDRLLPLFWAVDVMKEHVTRFKYVKVDAIDEKQLPSAQKAEQEFHAAMENQDLQNAVHAVTALSRVIGPKPTFHKVLHYAPRDHSFIGHVPIAIVNARRVLDVIGWRHAEFVLRWVMGQMFGERMYPLEKQSYPNNLEHVKRCVAELPIDWADSQSSNESARELYDLMLKGRWWIANQWIEKELKSGRIKAGTAWDAIHLACADLMICHKSGGKRLGNLALHSNTCVNALHYVFRSISDPGTRLLTLFQAVTVAVEFRLDEKSRDFLRDTSVVNIHAEKIQNAEQTIRDIFEAIPPRVIQKEHDDRSGQDKAAKLSFSFVKQFPNSPALLSAARQIMCRKLNTNAHEMKFPIAMFEDMNYVSATWRPHMMAATVVYMQGTNSKNNPAVARGIAESEKQFS